MINFAEKDALVEAGFLNKSQLSNLVLYNYSKQCEFQQHWIPATLESRGTIYDLNTGKVVARAFDKFFNVNQVEATKIENLPDGRPVVTVKEDGSLGIGFQFNGSWRVSTRGSFYSEQAGEATIMIEAAKMEFWPADWTPLFEIVYPENRIITDYGKERALYLIAARHIEGGQFMRNADLDTFARKCGFKRPKTVEYTVPELLQQMEELPGNDEGFVALWPNGLLVKFKGKRYMDLARFKADLSPLRIWEAIQANAALQFLEDCPDEFHPEALRHYNTLTLQYDHVRRHCEERARALGVLGLDLNDKELAKSKAKLIKQEPQWSHGFIFALMRGYYPEDFAWRMLRPENNQYVKLNEVMKP